MNSWNQNNNNNLQVGQANFSPYTNYMNSPTNFNRLPIYKADPIHGENAAWQFPIGGGEIYLPDADEDVIWWIKVDQNGNKQVIPFDVTPHKKPEPVDMNKILERLDALEEKINAKQNKSNAKRSAAVASPEPTAISD